MFVKEYHVEIYLTDLQLSDRSNPEAVIRQQFSAQDTVGKLASMSFKRPIDTNTKILLH
jgi:hypothetical protein